MSSDFDVVSDPKIRLAIFASGAGSNAGNCMRYFAQHNQIEVALIITNRKRAGVIEIAATHGVPCIVTNTHAPDYIDTLMKVLKREKIDYILLAGYLALIPEALIAAYRHKIFNVHPALLPKYGGKGMYGSHVHLAVYQNQETESGITIHEVDEVYDRGKILFRESVQLELPISPESIEHQVRKLEQQYLPIVVEKLLLNN